VDKKDKDDRVQQQQLQQDAIIETKSPPVMSQFVRAQATPPPPPPHPKPHTLRLVMLRTLLRACSCSPHFLQLGHPTVQLSTFPPPPLCADAILHDSAAGAGGAFTATDGGFKVLANPNTGFELKASLVRPR
jgi:hypothetical protein